MSSGRFHTLIQHVRQGDSAAWNELMEDYGPVVVNVARTRIGASKVRAILEPKDVRQSVMRSLFRRMTAGQFTLSEPAQLVQLLVANR